MNRPKESDYTSQVAYTRALEKYCDELQEQEPVGWIDSKGNMICTKINESCKPLYTHPPKREWVGLTDDEMLMIYGQQHEGKKYNLGRMVEAKLKEKNT
jgi:SpoVK/Ycf46/Vps4 family AAA+-type ATPase